ncbi:MAG: Hpt domain-containing protein [Burkholderiaceae bacterium]|nr:Hpt domain-containing protein [Burkholderiaceae bacterium]
MLNERLPHPRDSQPPSERPEGGAAEAPTADVLDHEALQRLRALDPTGSNHVMERVVKAFETSVGKLLPQLQSAMDAADVVSIRHVAHTLKSSSASIGAMKLSKMCVEIEAMILRGQDEGMGEKVAALAAEVPIVLVALQRMIDNNP